MKYTVANNALELDISLSTSSVTICESDDEAVELEFQGLRKKTVAEVFSIRFRDNRLHIKENTARYSPVIDALFNSSLPSDLILKVPRQTQLSGKVATVKGSIKTGPIRFRGVVKTVTGGIEIESISTDGLDVQNIGGGIAIGKLDGFVKGKTVAGDVTIKEGLFKEIEIRSVSGNISLSGDYHLESEGEISTVSGNIAVEVNAFRGEHNLVLSTLSGQASSAGSYPEGSVIVKPQLPFLKDHPFRSVMPLMKEKFASFFSSAEKGEVEVEVEPGTTDIENTKMILEMLSQGKLTVEEAEKLINALGAKR